MVDNSLLGDTDLHLFNEGTHATLHHKLGAHPMRDASGTDGTYFAVWAPSARSVRVIGDFNGWSNGAPLGPRDSSGIWEGFVPGVGRGALYKFAIEAAGGGEIQKSDPFAFWTEVAPKTASIVWQDTHEWRDSEWMDTRKERDALAAPMSIYEVHIGSWMRGPDDLSLSYREIAEPLANHVKSLGFTHVEFLPLAEHPFFGSWGYQVTGYFAPTSRFGTPEDLMYMIDVLHQNGIGVIMDWVPSHFPSDGHGLAEFDGTHLYEHADRRQGHHPDWDTLIFNYGRNEVRSFLLSSACCLLSRFHVDALRVDAVASMLYLDYSRKEGEWIPNRYGGRENLDAISFLKELNRYVGANYPGVVTIAEESTAWPMVSRPVDIGGLGFHFKWDMGWMHDTLEYFGHDPVHRKFHHGSITFRSIYAFSENFVLPLSHDEVVHGKGSLFGRMRGDEWQKHANLRLLYGYMYAQPGKKLLFMGSEYGLPSEWNHDGSIDWELAKDPMHDGVARWIGDLNHLYRSERAMHELECEPAGFEWIDGSDQENSVLAFARKDRDGKQIVTVCNFTPVPRHNYRIGVGSGGRWTEILNSDAKIYGGSGQGNLGGLEAAPVPMHGRWHSLSLTLPPLGIVMLRADA